MMDIAERRADRALAQRAVDIVLHTLELGWDAAMGGIFYFQDSQRHPPSSWSGTKSYGGSIWKHWSPSSRAIA